METLDFLLSLIDRYGYFIVTIAIMLESAGVPFPGETTLVIAAAFAGAGHLNITFVIICAALGAIVGDAGGYWAGRRLGRPFLERYGKWLHLTPERMVKLEKLFIRHGPMTVFFGRFFSLLRTYAALFAGVWRMPYATFTTYNAAGGVVWAACFGMLGYIFGQNLPMLQKVVHTIGWALTVPVLLIIIFAVVWRWMVKHQEKLKLRYRALVDKSFIGLIRKKYSWQIHWVLRHWTATQYTIMHIAVGLMIAFAGIFAFARIAQSAFSDMQIAQWDLEVYVTFQSWATPMSTTILKAVTLLGSIGAMAVAVGGFLFFSLRRKWLNAISVCTVVIGGQILVFALNVAFAHERPFSNDPANFSGIVSFPSGQVMQALVIYGLASYYLIIRLDRWRASTGIIFITLFLVLLIGFSRLYLGVNYLSDVLCGFVAGVVWLSSCITALELLRGGHVGDRRKHKRAKSKAAV
jgi:membrane protein DedA with SNARE-associated domain/membrane-associated phospholipid phosphatase